MAECICGEWISDDFHRVFSVDGAVHACPACNADRTRHTTYHPDGHYANPPAY